MMTALAFILTTIISSAQQDGPPKAAPITEGLYRKSYALVVGIDRYQDSDLWTALKNAQRDAQDVANLLTKNGFEVKLLLGPQATRQSIVEFMQDTLSPQLQRDDRVLFFFAGHGTTVVRGDKEFGYIIPYDGTDRTSTQISRDDVHLWSEMMNKAKHQLFIIDACFSGMFATVRGVHSIKPSYPDYVQQITSRAARQVLTAGGTTQTVVDGPEDGNSHFTAALLGALSEWRADMDGDGFIVFPELKSYLLAAATNRYQTPGSATLPGHLQGEFVFSSSSATVRPRVRRASGSGPETTRGAPSLDEAVALDEGDPHEEAAVAPAEKVDHSDRKTDDDPTQATPLEPRSIVRNDVGTGIDQVDWYSIVFPNPGTFRLEFTNLGEAASSARLGPVKILDSQQNTLDESHHAGVAVGNSCELGPITVSQAIAYFVQISASTDEGGPYELATQFAPLLLADTLEPNDTREQALGLRSEGSLTALMGYGSDLEDWYRISIPETGLFRFKVANLHRNNVKLGTLGPVALSGFDQVELDVTHHSGVHPGQEALGRIIAVSGGEDYYLRVRSNPSNAAPYHVSTHLTSLGRQDSREPNNRRGEASSIEPNGSVEAILGFGQDQVDWYKLRLPTNGTLRMSIANTLVAEVANGTLGALEILDGFQENVVTLHHGGVHPGMVSTSPLIALSAETDYFVKVPSVPGCAAPYRLESSFVPSRYSDLAEPNDEASATSRIGPVDEIEATVGYGSDRVDLYEIELVPGEFRVELTNRHEQETLHGHLAPVKLFDGSGKEIFSSHHGGAHAGHTSRSETFTVPSKGKYMLEVRPMEVMDCAPYVLTTMSRPRR